jgi:hypothetical protein
MNWLSAGGQHSRQQTRNMQPSWAMLTKQRVAKTLAPQQHSSSLSSTAHHSSAAGATATAGVTGGAAGSAGVQAAVAGVQAAAAGATRSGEHPHPTAAGAAAVASRTLTALGAAGTWGVAVVATGLTRERQAGPRHFRRRASKDTIARLVSIIRGSRAGQDWRAHMGLRWLVWDGWLGLPGLPG